MSDWYANTYVVAYSYMKSHTGGGLNIGKGKIQKKSINQKINTKSSMEAQLVAANDVLSHLL